jgi:ABC-2 type transport system ATP-binding protein
MTDTVIQVDALRKTYGKFVALDRISFTVEKGEIFGILGPNGAGKTTTVEIVEGLRKPDSGSVSLCGIDALRENRRIKQLIGAQLQSTSLYDNIRVREAVKVFGNYYRRSLPTDSILEEVSLTDKNRNPVSSLSGGQKQRLCIALALVNDPEIIFLDEPTTGLDPQARHNVWDIIEQLRDHGKTIMLTTHYMEEAEELCQHVAIIDHGKIIAMDTPADLIKDAKLNSFIEFSSSRPLNGISDKIPGIQQITDGHTHRYSISAQKVTMILKDLTSLCYENNIELESISVRTPTLEDVFLSLTGRKLRE